MKVTIDRDGCIGCGVCASDCPEVFSMADDNKAQAISGDVPENAQDCANDAVESCPVSVIQISE